MLGYLLTMTKEWGMTIYHLMKLLIFSIDEELKSVRENNKKCEINQEKFTSEQVRLVILSPH